MKRYFLSLLMAVVAMLPVFAQQMQLTPLPLMPGVKSGVLPNGLSYYIMHNEMPRERANFYIAQKVGSTLENKDQLGLAHFLEHMAFNGSTHYPGKAMLNYLQAKGIVFGADINAYTGFDETVYNINNVPTTDRPLMDSVLLVLRDWSDGIALEEAEIEAERGVIQEEWRSRNDVNSRMWEALLPQMYQEYQYQQMPIGSMDVVMNFKPEVLRDYYKRWYRPDQQGIVIVGDFDADEMEKKVIALFSDIVMPADAPERVYPTVSDNAEPIYATFTDPEMTNEMMLVMFKYDKTPFEMRNTAEAYLQDVIIERLISSMVYERLSERMQQPDCTFASAFFSFTDFMVSKTKGAVQISIVPKGDLMTAYKEVMTTVFQALKGGFNAAEYQRACDKMLSSLETQYNERNSTSNAAYGEELYRHFIDNEASPGIEAELNLTRQMLGMIPVEAVNQIAGALLEPQNEAIVVAVPTGADIPGKDIVVASLNDMLAAQYEMKLEEVITEPLIAKLPKPGKITSQAPGAYDSQVLTLSNGVKVIVKTTDFKGDQILFKAFRDGGKASYKEADGMTVQNLDEIVDYSNLGSFDPVKLQKYLAGKYIGLGFGAEGKIDAFNGMSNVKDLPTFMEVLYATFTSLNPNPEAFNTRLEKMATLLANQEKNPEYVFNSAILKAMYGDSPMFDLANDKNIRQIDYKKGFEMAKQAMANAADYTFVFVGNVDVETLKPLLEQYVATLPSKNKPGKVKYITPISIKTGQIENKFDYEGQTPSVKVHDIISGSNLEYNVKNSLCMDFVGQLLEMNYLETLREEEGGTYSPGAYAILNGNTGQWMVIYQYSTNPEQAPTLEARAQKELHDMLQNGANPEYFARIKEQMLKQYEVNLRENGVWLSRLVNKERGLGLFDGYLETLQNLTIEDLNAFMKNLYNGQNRIQVEMNTVVK